MSLEWISILALVAMFIIATALPINMGVIAFAGAFVIGIASQMSANEIFAGFPVQLFLALVGITYLFGIANTNGTIDWLVHQAVRLVGGHVAFIPWIMFGATAALAAIGAVGVASVAIVAPIALRFAAQYRISQLLMGVMVVEGCAAGTFSPISVLGTVVNGVMEKLNLPVDQTALFLNTLVFHVVLGVVIFCLFGGLRLLREGRLAPAGRLPVGQLVPAGGPPVGQPPSAGGSPELDTGSGERSATATERGFRGDEDEASLAVMAPPSLPTLEQLASIMGIVGLVVATVGFGLDVGLVAVTIAFVLALLAPSRQKEVTRQIAWPVVLLVTGILTYIAVLQTNGTIDYVGEVVERVPSPLLAALLMCYIAGIVSAFASSVGTIGAMVPLAAPFLLAGDVGIMGFVIAISISATIVDISPYSGNGAMVLANAQKVDLDRFYKQLLGIGAAVVVIAPGVCWLLFVVLGIGG